MTMPDLDEKTIFDAGAFCIGLAESLKLGIPAFGENIDELRRVGDMLASNAAKLERPAVEGTLRDLCNGNFNVLLTRDELRSMLGGEPADDMPVKITIHPV